MLRGVSIARRERAYTVDGPSHHKFLQLNEAGNLGLTRRTPRRPEVKNDNFTVEVRRPYWFAINIGQLPGGRFEETAGSAANTAGKKGERLGSANKNTAPANRTAKAPHRQMQRRDSHEYLFFRGMSSHPSVG